MSETISAVKRTLIGRPLSSRQLKHTLLPKWMALPVFSSDPMSSVAYATEEMMLVLALAGAAAFSLVLPLSLGVAALLVVVVASYRQTVRAYPQGGGAYRVSRENLGNVAGLTAASALMIDYVLTVAVSIAAGVAAIASALPVVAEHKVAVALAFVALVTLANLRGVKEAGVLFALPTYTFVVTMLVMVVVGVTRCVTAGCPSAPTAGTALEVETGLGLFLLLRAFSSGATALTGVEAISDGVQAFRYPQSHNAAATLAIMGGIAVTLFLGISFLAVQTGVVAFEGMEQTVTSQIAQAVFGGQNSGFYLVQAVTAAILVLAANTAYADFPRLSSILAGDRFLPRQFLARGDRLVFSNGVLLLAGGASLLLVAFGAEVTRLIQLYVVGVFTSFTLSQTGMVRHWLRTRQRGYRRSLTINAVGAMTTGVVLVVVAVTKFTGGAWIVLVAIPLVVWLMSAVHGHYRRVSLELRAGVAEPEPARRNHLVILLDRVDESVARALSYASAVGAASVRAVAVSDDPAALEERWAGLRTDVALEIVPDEQPVDRLAQVLHGVRQAHPGEFATAVVAETLSRSWVDILTKHRVAVQLKQRLVASGELVVANVTSPDVGPGPYTVEEPAEHHVVVLVAAVHKATIRALAYAQGLEATSIRALSVNLESEASGRILREWDDWGVQVPLELVDSPFRSLADTVREYVRDFHADGRSTIVTCVLPEFTLPHWWYRPLHNQTALLIKGTLLFERGVVTTSVPYPLLDRAAPDGPGA